MTDATVTQSPSCSSPSWDGSGMGPWTEPQLTVAGSFLVPHTVLVSIMNDHRLVDLKATDTVLSQCLVTASILGLWPHRFSLWPLSTQGLLFCSQISMCLPPTRVHARVLSRFSRAPLCATPWTVARQAPLSVGFSRQEHWSGLPCSPPGDLPDPGIEPASLTSPALAGWFFTTTTSWEALQGYT